jgi:predicted metal-dependent phosphoesterase TrpH
MLKADFHVHTSYSRCSNMNPADVSRVAKSNGYDVICVVDHNTIKGGLAARRCAGRGLLVIPGEEIKTNMGEVIVLLSDGKYGRDLVEVCQRANDENHFVFAPHPFDLFRATVSIGEGIGKVKSLIDAIEVFNSRVLLQRFNKKAESYAKSNGIPRIAGSDAHFLGEIGNAACLMDCEKNADSVLESIRKNRVKFECKRTFPPYNFVSMVVSIKKML